MDEMDLELVHLLQAHPRISWADASKVLGVSANSLSSRWEHLRSEGIAWITTSPGEPNDHTVAFINVHCMPGTAMDASRQLARDPRVVTIDLMVPATLLHVTVMTPTMTDLSELVTTDLPAVPGIVSLDAFLVTAVHRAGAAWSVSALGREQLAAVERLRPREQVPARNLKASDDDLLKDLFADGRASAADLARSTGRSPSTVRRQLADLLGSGLTVLRCDVSHVDAGWPVASTWWVKVPPAKNVQTVQSLASIGAVRFCASVTGSANMTFIVYTRAIGDLVRVERALGEALPWLEVQDINVTMRSDKRMGWLLDANGRATGERVMPTVLERTATRGSGVP